MKHVEVERIGAIAKITLNRPEAFNALNNALGVELGKAIEDCFDPEIRAVIITGAGKSFCSGGDLLEMRAAGTENLSDFLRDLTKLFHRLITDIRLLPKPVIAAINGPLGGGGLSLALACDLRYAASGVKFKQAYTSTGLCPDGGFTVFLPAMVGFSKASELLLLDPIFTAETAQEWGIVHDVFSKDEFADKVMDVAEKLASGATQSFGIAKRLLNESLFPLLEKQLELERQGMILCGKTRDAATGITAFFEKSKPDFTGQ